jgi:molybdopterin converting factor subunit 1
MRVRVLLFAGLRERVGSKEVVLEGLPQRPTVRDVQEALRLRFPVLASDPAAAAVNLEYAPPERVLVEGDEVAFLPPVSGG